MASSSARQDESKDDVYKVVDLKELALATHNPLQRYLSIAAPFSNSLGCLASGSVCQAAGTIQKTVLQFIKEGAGDALWWEDRHSRMCFKGRSFP